MDYNNPKVVEIMRESIALKRKAEDMVALANQANNQADRNHYIDEAKRLAQKSEFYKFTAKMWTNQQVGA